MGQALPAAGSGTKRRLATDCRWLGVAACLNLFRGFSESKLKWEKIPTSSQNGDEGEGIV